MLRRVFWFGTGATAGFGGAMWIRRRLLRAVRRLTPERVQAEVGDSVRRLGTGLRDAVVEGRNAMASREAELRSELRPGPPGGGATDQRRTPTSPPGNAAPYARSDVTNPLSL